MMNHEKKNRYNAICSLISALETIKSVNPSINTPGEELSKTTLDDLLKMAEHSKSYLENHYGG